MINPLLLGSRSFPINLIQGPLAGISCAPFRRLAWEYSKPAFSCTEMISCKTLLHQSRSNHRFIKIDEQEGPVCFQLSSKDPYELGEATKLITDHGASLIDLNCGCPVNKIRSRGAGSSLLKEHLLLSKLIEAMKNNTHLPVSIKIRIDGRSKDQNNRDLIAVIKEAEPDFLIVHGRHWTEGYDIACHYEQIQFFVEELPIPVIGNGDIACVDSLKKMFATGCSGVMIARAGVGQPWLIGELVAKINNGSFAKPSNQEIGALYITHIKELALLLQDEKFAVIQARKFAKYYARPLPNRADFFKSINQCEDLKHFQSICDEFFIPRN